MSPLDSELMYTMNIVLIRKLEDDNYNWFEHIFLVEIEENVITT
jgi:hypothetical protein